MANVSRPNGFVPVGTYGSGGYVGDVRVFLADQSTAIYIGDPVKSGGSAGAAGVTVYGLDCEGVPNVDVAAAGNTLLGVVVGFSPKQTDLSVLHKEATSTKRLAYVDVSPYTIYEVQEDNIGNDIAVTQVGNNFDLAYTAGNATTGISGALLDSSDSTGTATAQFRLLSLSKRVDNSLGTSAKWLVMINEHEYKTTTGT